MEFCAVLINQNIAFIFQMGRTAVHYAVAVNNPNVFKALKDTERSFKSKEKMDVKDKVFVTVQNHEIS